MFKLIGGLTFVLLTASAASAEDRRQLGTHEHGHGTLNIAIEGNRVSMNLEAPAADIVGFEHEAVNAEERDAIDQAKAILAAPLDLFRLPASASCALLSAEVKLLADEHAVGPTSAPLGADNDQSEHQGHWEIHSDYVLDCKSAVGFTGLGLDYFKIFPGARSLTVNVIGPTGQSSSKTTREAPTLIFQGPM